MLPGGLALTKLSLSQSYSDNINFFAFPPGGAANLSSSATKVGWVVGGGLEYLYVRFDGISANDFANFTNNLAHFATRIVRFGINYKFGDAPIVTK
jgi:hypothetical protein